MIPEANIIHWRKFAPWPNDAQVEQDLIISRALVEIFNHIFLREQLAFRGGTALYKIFLNKTSRYSEDIDLVLVKDQEYGPIIDALRKVLTPWLGTPNVKTRSGKITLRFKFTTEIQPVQDMKLKVEINTEECFSILGLEKKQFKVESPWFNGETKISTFRAEELLGTKLRALYQREKGRDLFDMETAHNNLTLNVDQVVDCFIKYTKKQGLNITRAQYEQNLASKKISKKFLNDITPLLRSGQSYEMDSGFQLVESKYINKLSGDPWKGQK